MALAYRCRLDQSLRFRASEREVAEIANVARASATKALRRLAREDLESGAPAFIIAHQRADNFGAGEYSLLLDVLPSLSGDTQARVVSSGECAAFKTGDLSHDAFSPKRRQNDDTEADMRAGDSIGKSTLACLQWLRTHPASTAAEIALGVGVAKRTAERAVLSLASIHKIERVEDDGSPILTPGRPAMRWRAWRLTESDLNVIARNAGTIGRTDKKRRRHQAERESFEKYKREYIAQLREEIEAKQNSSPDAQRTISEAEQEAMYESRFAQHCEELARQKGMAEAWTAQYHEEQKRRARAARRPASTRKVRSTTDDCGDYDTELGLDS